MRYEPDSENGRRLRRITDHVRACTFAIHENVYPGSNKEKYVVRRLLRRAVLDGHQMGQREPFLYRIVPTVAETIPGFAHPAPLSLLQHGVAGKALVYCTTNGTVAMAQCAGASRIYCGALLNARALAAHVIAAHPGETVLIVCAGSGNNFNFEDFFGAGYFVEQFAALLLAPAAFSDAARAARAGHRSRRALHRHLRQWSDRDGIVARRPGRSTLGRIIVRWARPGEGKH